MPAPSHELLGCCVAAAAADVGGPPAVHSGSGVWHATSRPRPHSGANHASSLFAGTCMPQDTYRALSVAALIVLRMKVQITTAQLHNWAVEGQPPHPVVLTVGWWACAGFEAAIRQRAGCVRASAAVRVHASATTALLHAATALHDAAGAAATHRWFGTAPAQVCIDTPVSRCVAQEPQHTTIHESKAAAWIAIDRCEYKPCRSLTSAQQGMRPYAGAWMPQQVGTASGGQMMGPAAYAGGAHWYPPPPPGPTGAPAPPSCDRVKGVPSAPLNRCAARRSGDWNLLLARCSRCSRVENSSVLPIRLYRDVQEYPAGMLSRVAPCIRDTRAGTQ